MKSTLVLIFTVFLLFVLSCRISEKAISLNNVNKDTIVVNEDLSRFIDSVNSKFIQYSTIEANFSGNYSDPKSNVFLKGIIRIKTNQFIWISIRPISAVEVSRILIEPDSIHILDRLNNEYYSEDFNYLSSKLNLKTNFNIIESILTGKMFFYPIGSSEQSYEPDKNDSGSVFQIHTKKIQEHFKHTMHFNMPELLLNYNELLFSEHSHASFFYSEYNQYQSKYFFGSLKIKAESETVKISADFVLDKVIFDKELSAPFKIPETYKRIHSN